MPHVLFEGSEKEEEEEEKRPPTFVLTQHDQDCGESRKTTAGNLNNQRAAVWIFWCRTDML